MAKAANKLSFPAPAFTLDSIQPIVTSAPAKKKGNPEVAVSGVADLTAIDRVIADLEDAKSAIEEQVRAVGMKRLLDEGCASKQRPGNFKAFEDEVIDGAVLHHSVSVELSASGSPLSEAATTLAAEHDIPVDTKVLTNETYIINPAYAGNRKVMEQVVTLLTDAIAKGLLPNDPEVGAILQFQPGNSKTVTTEETLPAIFKLPRETVEIALPLFAKTLMVGKCKYAAIPGQEDDLTAPLLRTAKLINRPAFRAEMQLVAAKKKAEKAEKARRA